MKPAYDDVLKQVLKLERKGIFLSLEPTRNALRLFGNPHSRFPSVLVGGTNGKGSTVAMLTSVLRAEGYRVGTYTSPHLLDIRERIQLNLENISKDDFSDLAFRISCKTKNARLDLSFFEFLTVMAFTYFFEKKIDIAVVEVGLGGRWDATNVLNPLVSVITSIGMDHERFLGKSLSQIAYEKGGIIKNKGVLVTAVAQRKIRDQLKGICLERGARGFFLATDFFVKSGGEDFDYKDGAQDFPRLKLGLHGKFQRQNAACAVSALSQLKSMGWQISDRAIRSGLKDVFWPGRFEIVQTSPRVLLDGAHNLAGIHALFHSLVSGFEYDKLHLVFGVMEDKNYRAMIRHALKFSDSFYFVEPPLKRSLTAEKLRWSLQSEGGLVKKIRFRKELREVLPELVKRCGGQDLICVTGSLYAVSEAKKCLDHSARHLL